MPWSQCPLCGTLSQLLIRQDLESWYSTLFPTIPAGEIVPAKCFDCFPEIREGDSVELRNQNGERKAGASEGYVIKILSAPDGLLYKIQFENGVECLARFQFRKTRQYHPQNVTILKDGTLRISTSGIAQDGERWDGFEIVTKEHPHYQLWKTMASNAENNE
ncbi:MAG: hypothetical protein JNM27_09650 [Leptospirales bacterium]|nr:hypothetical protein [Leptospirales bacterium]